MVVAAYMLIRMETTIKSFAKAQGDTNDILIKFTEIIQKCTGGKIDGK
jgi:hypothetical protein